jgi:hypothetical protein
MGTVDHRDIVRVAGADPYAYVMDRVSDGCGDADEADLANALGSERGEQVRFSDEGDVNVGDVGVDGDEVVAERGVGDASGCGGR